MSGTLGGTTLIVVLVVGLIKFVLPKREKAAEPARRKRYRVVNSPDGGVVVESVPDDGTSPPRPRKPAFSGHNFSPARTMLPPRPVRGGAGAGAGGSGGQQPRDGSFTSLGRIAPTFTPTATPSQSHHGSFSSAGKVAPAPEPLLMYHQFQQDQPRR